MLLLVIGGNMKQIAEEITKLLPEQLNVDEFAHIVGTILKEEYGTHNFNDFKQALDNTLKGE